MADVTKSLTRLLRRCRIESGKDFSLANHAPDETGGLDLSKPEASKLLESSTAKIANLQETLYAEGRWSLLILFQAMDAGGKDSSIAHVFSGLNPQGCQVSAFKAPGPAELGHDFLWRHVLALPRRGQIGIHNRSWYEEALVPRIHPAVLEKQKLPEAVQGKHFWKDRLHDIRNFEGYLGRQGMVVLKFFLHISKEEQRQRLLARLDNPDKHWKFDPSDLAERSYWDDYQHAYERAIAETSTKEAPWYVLPANSKPLTRLLISTALAQTLEGLNLRYPDPPDGLETARKALS